MTSDETMEAAVRRYLHERRQLGFALKAPGTELLRFARFADARDHHGPLTQELQFDWAAGILRIVKCKSRRVDVMPLPQTTGIAIAAYLRAERPHTASRRVFVRHVAPADEPVGPDVVRRAVREAYQRCGLPYTRVHILRHTLASRLLNTGGTLKEVADVLRHRELNTSQIYAKVDIGRLSAVAMPWPGSAT